MGATGGGKTASDAFLTWSGRHPEAGRGGEAAFTREEG